MLLENKNAVIYGAGGGSAGAWLGRSPRGGLAQMTMLRRAPRLHQVADTAAFLASDRAAAITGTIVNASCGPVPAQPQPDDREVHAWI